MFDANLGLIQPKILKPIGWESWAYIFAFIFTKLLSNAGLTSTLIITIYDVLTMFVALASDTKPSLSNIIASLALATFPSICKSNKLKF